MSHPVAVAVTTNRSRRRLTTIFRPILAIPLVAWGYLWGVAALVAVVVAWFAALITGRVPDVLHTFIARYLRYATQAAGYTTLLGEKYPGFLGDRTYEVDASLPPAQDQDRVKVLLRLVLAIPVLILAEVLKNLWCVIAVFGWVVAIVTEELPSGFRNIGAWILRFYIQTLAYAGLVTERYPQIDVEPRISGSLAY